MPWIEKGNGRYYYRSRREGDRVISEYIGCGPLAEMIAQQDEQERIERQLERRHELEKRHAHKSIEREVDELSDLINCMVQAAYLITGHHTHKRQWRKRKNE
jgi:hypothetical protein